MLLRAALGMVVFASILVSAASAMAASIIYGSAYIGPSGQATLYTISPTTGAATVIGPIGFTGVGALAVGPNGVLYGIGNDANGNASLLTINIATGAGTLVGELGLGSVRFQDIAFRPSDGTLYANATGSNGKIYTVNVTTGAATLLGITGTPNEGDALAFSSSNVLYTATQSNLDIINQSTGVGSLLVNLTYPISDSRANGMKFDPVSGTLYASVVSGFPGGNYLATIDIGSGLVTKIGPTVGGLDAIAIAATGSLADTAEPGSVIVFPKFSKGKVLVDGVIMPKTEIELGAVCPTDEFRDDGTCIIADAKVIVHMTWICEGKTPGATCQNTDFTVTTSINGKIRFNPDDIPMDGGTTVVPAPCQRGYLIGWVVNASGQAVVFDTLIGDVVQRNNFNSGATATDLQSFSGLGIQAVANRDLVTFSDDGKILITDTGTGFPRTLNFDGEIGHYAELTGQISGDVRYDQDDVAPFADTFLIFLTLDIGRNPAIDPGKTGSPLVSVPMTFYTENEVAVSAGTFEFTCWGQVQLSTFNPNLTTTTMSLIAGKRSPKGIVVAGQAFKDGDPEEFVTLLGLIQTTEGPTAGPLNAVRSYTNRPNNNSVLIEAEFNVF